jgi:hypothetical protein
VVALKAKKKAQETKVHWFSPQKTREIERSYPFALEPCVQSDIPAFKKPDYHSLH